MRLVAIALLTSIAVGLFFLLSSGPGNAPVFSVATSGVPDPPPDEETIEAPPLQQVGPVVEERTSLQEVTAVEEVPQAETSLLQGRVILTDESGTELVRLQGTITLVCWKGNSGAHEEREVIDGEFDVDVQDVEGLSVSELILDGRGAVLDDPRYRFAVDSGPIVVRVHWPKSLLLNVLSQETGAHLSDISVVAAQGTFSDARKHPGRPSSNQLLLTDQYSPLELHPSTQEFQSTDAVYYVHSPGLAWKAIHLDLSSGGEREIRLEAGGDAEIQVEGAVPERGATLRLRRADAPGSVPYAEVGFRGAGPVEIVGLAPGTYRVTAESGRWFERPPALGEVELVIQAGARTQVELHLELPEKPVAARLAGDVVVPREWRLSSFDLEAALIGVAASRRDARHRLSKSAMQQLDGEHPMWAFDFGEISTGSYTLELSGRGELGKLEYSISVTLEPGGSEDVFLELPPPATVVVHILDPATGEAAEVRSIFWGALADSAQWTRSQTSASPVEGESYFEFSAPIGSISVGTFGSGYDTLRETLEIGPGRNEFTFRLDRACPLTITFLDGETPVPLADSWYPSPEHLDGEGELLYTSGGTSGLKTALSQPGRYVFEIPDFPGFEPVPTQTITVQRGEQTNHVIHLVRRQR